MSTLPSAGSAVISAVGATTTSSAIEIDNYENISIQCICSGHTSGNGKFEVLGSNDGVNFATLLNLIGNGTAATPPTRVNSLTLSANGSDFVFLDNVSKPRMIQVKLTFTTDGVYTAIVNGNKKTVR